MAAMPPRSPRGGLPGGSSGARSHQCRWRVEARRHDAAPGRSERPPLRSRHGQRARVSARPRRDGPAPIQGGRDASSVGAGSLAPSSLGPRPPSCPGSLGAPRDAASLPGGPSRGRRPSARALHPAPGRLVPVPLRAPPRTHLADGAPIPVRHPIGPTRLDKAPPRASARSLKESRGRPLSPEQSKQGGPVQSLDGVPPSFSNAPLQGSTEASPPPSDSADGGASGQCHQLGEPPTPQRLSPGGS